MVGDPCGTQAGTMMRPCAQRSKSCREGPPLSRLFPASPRRWLVVNLELLGKVLVLVAATCAVLSKVHLSAGLVGFSVSAALQVLPAPETHRPLPVGPSRNRVPTCEESAAGGPSWTLGQSLPSQSLSVLI